MRGCQQPDDGQQILLCPHITGLCLPGEAENISRCKNSNIDHSAINLDLCNVLLTHFLIFNLKLYIKNCFTCFQINILQSKKRFDVLETVSIGEIPVCVIRTLYLFLQNSKEYTCIKVH